MPPDVDASVGRQVPVYLRQLVRRKREVVQGRDVLLELVHRGRADRSPADLWPEPRVGAVVPSGPVRVSLTYRVIPADAPAFSARMEELRQLRLRDGAVDWVLERDLADPDRFVESFHVRSWQEHLRQHERLTHADLSLENDVRELGAGGGQPPVTHLVEVDRHASPRS